MESDSDRHDRFVEEVKLIEEKYNDYQEARTRALVHPEDIPTQQNEELKKQIWLAAAIKISQGS
jgi:hypothetical protein